METTILNEIRRTNELLEYIVYILIAFVALWAITSAIVVFLNLKRLKTNTFNDNARNLYKTEEYDELIKLCTQNLISNPKDTYALYWKAKAKNRIGSADGLEEIVEALLDIAPRWKEDWMEKYSKTNHNQSEDKRSDS